MKQINDRSTAALRPRSRGCDLRRGALAALLLASGGLASQAHAGNPSPDNHTAHPDRNRRNDMTNDHRQQNGLIVRRLFEAFNHDDLQAFDELVAPEYVGPQGDQRGPTAFRAITVGLRTAFPDLHYTVDDLLAEGEGVAVRWHWTGTHEGPFRGHPATGHAVTNNGIGIFRVRDGRIVAASLETDRLGFLQQIGVIPEGVASGVGAAPRPSPAPATTH